MARSFLSLLVHISTAFAVYGLVVWMHQAAPDPADLPALDWRFSEEASPRRQPVQLPHYWTRNAATRRNATYTAAFQLSAPPESPWSVYVQSVGSRVEVSINGIEIGIQHGDTQRRRFQPELTMILPSLLVSGENVVELGVAEDSPGTGFLDRVFIGPTAVLEPAHTARLTLKLWFPLTLAIAGFVIGALVLMLYTSRPSANYFLWYAIASFLGSFFVAAFLVPTPPLPAPWWDGLIVAVICWFGIAVVVIGMDYLGRSSPSFVRSQLWTGIGATAGVGLCAAALPGADFYGYALPAVLTAHALWSAIFLAVFSLRQPRRKTDPVPFWMTLAAVLLCTAGAHDHVMLMGFQWSWLRPQDGLYFPFPAVPVLILCTVLLVRRYLLALNESEALNRELAARVAAREAQIERSYRELQRVDQERAAAAERERLFADMHDGLGGTLMTALARADNRGEGKSQSATAIRDALADLRLMLNSMEPGEQPLAYELATLRERLAPLCADASIELSFHLLDLPDDLVIAPARTLSLMRIVQEACTNVLRHAHARRMQIRAQPLDHPVSRLRLVVDDDGQGFDPDQAIAAGHHGLSNIRRRAQALKATVTWTALSPGTRMELQTPVIPP